MSGPQVGAVAVNVTTGEERMWDGQQWVPVSQLGKLTKEDSETLTGYRTVLENSRMLQARMQQFQEMNRGEGTGWLGGLTGKVVQDPENAGMSALTSEMVNFRHLTPGPMTDSDAKRYERSLPSVWRTGPQNDQVIAQTQQLAAVAAEKAQAADAYAMRFGTLRGFDQAFDSGFRADGPAPQRQEPAPQAAPAQPPPRRQAPATAAAPGPMQAYAGAIQPLRERFLSEYERAKGDTEGGMNAFEAWRRTPEGQRVISQAMGGGRPSAPAAAPAQPRKRVYNPQTGRLE